MRKVTFFLTLLLTFAGVTSASAQLWRPTQRATELKANTQYMLYNTAWESPTSGDRTGFIFNNGSGLGHSGSPKKKPATFVVTESKYLWMVDPTGNDCEYYMKNVSSNTYVGPGGVTSNASGVNLYIQPWMTSQAPKATVASEAADGTVVKNDAITADNCLFTICGTGLTSNGQSKGSGDCWNGNPDTWAKWADSHPWAFYEVEQMRTAEEVAAYNTAKENMDGATFTLQTVSGLVTSADKYTTNALQSTEGSIAELLDGTYTTFFHSRYSGDAVNENHYLQAELPEAKTSIRFYFKKRSQNNNNRPTNIVVQGSNDGTTFTDITTISSGLPTDASVLDYYSPVISSETAYKYYRFVVTATNNGAKFGDYPFFTMSEFYVFAGDDKIANDLIDAKKALDALAWDAEDFNTVVANAETACTALQEAGGAMAEAILALQNAISSASAYTSDNRIGTDLNQYTQPAGDQNLAEAVTEATALLGNADATADEINAKAEALTTLVSNLTINQPAPNNFYRIRCTASGMKRLISDINSTNNRLNLEGGTTNANSIFYYNNNKLLAYTNGLYMNEMVFAAAGSQGTDVAFTNGASTRIGTYFFKCGSRWLYGDGDTLDSGTGTDSRAGYVWWLEPVDALPVSVGEAGFATLWAPVALTIPADVTAYAATFDQAQNALVLEEVSGTIPANTGVVLKAAEGSYTFNIPANAETATVSSALTGQVNAVSYTYDESAATKVYTLQTIETGTVGFKLFNGTQLSGFKARFETDATTMNALRFIFGQTTGIANVATEGNKTGKVFDLSGRRIAAPAKGIYIVNGKKVIFK